MNQTIYILHLEDDPLDAELVRAKIEEVGLLCQITCVKTRNEFEAALQQGGYDVILADFQLPMFDGMSALRLAQEVCSDIPFIFVSGTMGEEAVIEGLTKGATDYVLKQRLSRLASAIPNALREAENRRERRRAEEELRASEARFRTFVDHAADAFFLHDKESRILDVNRQACESLGYSREELIGMTPCDFDENMDHALVVQMQTRLDAGEVLTFDTFHRCKDGAIFPVEVRVRPFWEGHQRFSVSLVRDMSARKQAEIEQKRLLAQIQEQAQQVQNIIDTVPEGVILLNGDQVVTLTNPVARQYLVLLAPHWTDGQLTSLGNRPVSELLTSPPKGLWHEIVSNSSIFEAIARPVENSLHSGSWVLVLRDVTQEKEIQQRVQQQDRLAAVGQLAAGIAHDFNNILAVILLYTQFISRTSELPKRPQELLRTIEQQTSQAANLIRQILDFSRQSMLERKPFDLLPLVETLVALLRRTLPENIHIELAHTNETYFIEADSTRMQQVLMNLAVNARDAMPEGGSLQINLAHKTTTAPQSMYLEELPPGEWIQIEVTDSGEGIPPEILSKIFEPFFTSKELGRGTGLGLAQVYGIIQQHEGYIDVVTEVGKGTTFFIYFPALYTDNEAVNMADTTALQLGQKQKILLVEDNQVTREALSNSLNLLNYTVMTATNGREALSLLETAADEVALILSDVIMPQMGGIALFHTLQEQQWNIPIVLMTGHPLSQELENLQEMGLAGWLLKPPDLGNLSHLIANALES